MKTKLNRFLSMLLCLTMVLGMVPAFRLFAVSEATEQTHAIHAASELTEENGWTRISGTLTASALTGNVYLTDDAAIAETVTIPAGVAVHLCLNGHTINVAAGKQIVVNGTLTLCDGDAGTGTIKGATGSTVSGLISVIGTFDMYGGKITGHTTNTRTGGVYVGGSATFTMHGGSITGNSGVHGGAVFVEGGTVYIKGGSITGNSATTSAGAIRVNGGTVNISGGEISGNSTNGYGGAMWINAGTVNMSGGTIKSNTASNAGAIYIPAGAMNMSGGLITEHSMAGTNCAGVYVNGGSFTMTGGELSGNSNQSLRGDAGTVTISGASVIDMVRPNGASFTLKEFAEGASVYATAEIEHDNTVAAVGETAPFYYCCNEEEAHGGTTYNCGAHKSHSGWTALDGNMSFPASGRVILTEDVTLLDTVTVAAGEELHICLDGNTINIPAGKQIVVNGTLTLCDGDAGTGTIKGATGSTVSGLISVIGTFDMYGGKITGHTTNTRTGGVYVGGSATFTMYGGSITGNSGVHGGAIFTEGTTTITGNAKIYSNTATSTAGAIRINGGTTTISGNADIYENSTPATGGAIWVNNGTLNMADGTIQNNTALDAGAVYIANGTMTMSGGKIIDHAMVNTNCGGVKLGAGSFTMTGGTIKENSNQGIKATGTGYVAISGASTVDCVTVSGASAGIELKNLTEGASIYATTKLPYDSTVEADEAEAPYHYTYKDPNAEPDEPEEPVPDIAGHEGWKALKGEVNAIAAGSYILTGDLQLKSALNLSGAVKICLNGYTVTGVAAPYFTVDNGAELTICDCSENQTGKLDGSVLGKTGVAGLVSVSKGGTFVLNSGTITGHSTTYRTGGVAVYGAFKMNGGKITRSTGLHGGALFVEGTFEMTGGEITGNTATSTAGAIRLNPGSVATISGGTISNNTAPAGGAFYTVAGSTLNMTGGNITGNNGTTESGAMTLCGTFNMSGGFITGNVAPARGAITGSGCVFNMTGGVISDNGSAPASRIADGTAVISGCSIIDQGGISATGDNCSITVKELVKGASIYGATALTIGDKTVHVAQDVATGLNHYTWNKPASNGMHIETEAGAIEGNKLQVAEDATSSVQLVAKFDADVPALVPNYQLVWSSSNETVATVSQNGLLTYKGYGSAKITATVLDANGEESDYYTFLQVQVGENPLRILAIGNELSREYMYYLGQLGLLTDTHIQAAYLSAENASLRDHAYNMAAGSVAYSYYKTDLQTGKLTAFDKTSVAAALEDEQWDIILLQHSVTAVGWPTTYNSDLEYLIDYFHGEEPNAKVYWTMSWALEDGFSGASGHGFDFGFRYDNSQKRMFNAIVESMEQAIVGSSSQYGSELEGYVPVGAAIQNLRAVRGDTLSRDGYLLSLEAGRLTAALTLLETLVPGADISKISVEALADILEEKDMDGQEVLSSTVDPYVNDAAGLQQIKTTVAAACQTAAQDQLPETFTGLLPKENKNADTIVVQSTAPWAPRTPNFAQLSDGTYIMGYSLYVDHALTTGLGNMQEGTGTNFVVSGQENPDGSITWNFDEPLLELNEAFMESRGVVTVSDRYARIKENPNLAASAIVVANWGDMTMEVAWIDMDGNGEKEEVLLCTCHGLVGYQNGSIKRSGYLLYSLDAGKTWSDPYYVTTSNGPMLKFGSSAMFDDGQILMPYYGQYMGGVLIEWSVAEQNWVQVADYQVTWDDFDEYTQGETTEFNEIDFESPDGSDTVYAMVRASGAIMRSYDRGKTWEQIGNEPGLIGQPNIITLDEEHLLFVWVNQDNSPRDTYVKMFNVNGDWTDYPTVKVYASPDRTPHDTGNPGGVVLSDGRVLIASYDISYRCFAGNYIDPWSEAFQPLELDSSIENLDLFVMDAEGVELGQYMLDEAITGPHTVTAQVQFTADNGYVTVHAPAGTLMISAAEFGLAKNVKTYMKVSIVGSDAYVKVWQDAEPQKYTRLALTPLAEGVQVQSGISGAYATLDALTVSKRIVVTIQPSLTGVPLAPDAQIDYSINPVQTAVSWRSSDESVVTVSDTGVVHFVSPGTADVILSVWGKEYVCKLKVNEQPAELTGKGETVEYINDSFDTYGTGDDAFWNAYWDDPESSNYWFNVAQDGKDAGLTYNIREEKGNKYLEIHSMGAASWTMTKEEITGDYTVQYDFRFYTTHFNSPSDRFNNMLWQTVDADGKTRNAVDIWANLRQEGFQFYSTSTDPQILENHYGLYERGVWTTVKIVRTNGAIYVKVWPAGTEEPNDWNGILFNDAIVTDIASCYRMVFAPKSGWEGKFDMDNLLITQQVVEAESESPVEATRTHLGNSLSQQFAVSDELIPDGGDAYAVIDKQNADGTVETQKVWQDSWGKEGDKHVITFSGVDAKEMTDTFTVKLYNAAGQAIGSAYTDSTKDYAMRQIRSTSEEIEAGTDTKKNTKIRTMMVDMLNYGASAQNYFDHNTDNLANKELTEAQQFDWATQELAEITNTRTKGYMYQGTRLNLKSSLGFQMAFKLGNVDLSKIEVRYSYTDHYGKLQEGTITNGQTVDGLYVITVDAVVLADARKDVTVTVYLNGLQIDRVTDSIAAYVDRVLDGKVTDAKQEELKALCEMLMKFADSSHTYLHHNDNGGNN